MQDTELVEAPASLVSLIAKEIVPLYKQAFNSDDHRISLTTALLKSTELNDASAQNAALGRKEHPFDWAVATNFQTANEHHAACVHAKVASTVGLGFVSDETQAPSEGGEDRPQEDRKLSKVDRILDPLCEYSFQDALDSAVEDFWQVGNGFIEVVRRGIARTTTSPGGTSRLDAGAITGLHHLPSSSTFKFLENNLYDYHFEVTASSGEGGQDRRFARFGDKDGLIARAGSESVIAPFTVDADPDNISEVIHFRRPTSLSRWYGFPDWLSGVALIELVQCLHQWKYDYFLNRGVPEFMLFILGQKLAKSDWEKIETSLRANIGKGNSHKSLAINLSNKDIVVQLEKLGMDSKTDDQFKDLKENLAVGIVTAHGVPPLLAGILIPGKLGASNELPNALQAFQALKIGPAQRVVQQTLARTLGNQLVNGGLGLQESDFHLNRITDAIDLGIMDTTSRMREPVASAVASGRDVSDGLRD